MDTAKSVRFILDRGSGLEKARIRWILYGVEPEPNVTLRLSELQNADGGFPFDMVKGNLSTIDSTLVALWWMEELGMLASATADRTYTHLLTVQQDDGGWDEDPAIAQYDLPPWVRPGELGTRLYLSSYAAYWLAVAGYQTVPAFRKVLDFVVRHQDERGMFHGYLHTTWIATSVLHMAGQPYLKAAARGIQALLARSPSEWADSQLAWALDWLSRAGLAQDHLLVARCLSELMQRQRPDGNWASEDGEGYAVGATIQAVKVLKHYGLLSPEP
jgi:squalene cyclase